VIIYSIASWMAFPGAPTLDQAPAYASHRLGVLDQGKPHAEQQAKRSRTRCFGLTGAGANTFAR